MQVFALVCVCIAFTIFLVYNCIAIGFFGIPSSLSNTFYLYNEKKKNLGYVFTGMMFTMALTLLPGWIEISENASSWSSNLTFLAFFTCAAICFVGAAPAFRDSEMESKVHTISAEICAASALLWDFIVCWKIMYVPIIVLLLIAGIAHLTKTAKTGLTYWLEMVAFYATFFTIAVQLGIWMY